MIHDVLYVSLVIGWTILNSWLFSMTAHETGPEKPDPFHVFLIILAFWAIAFATGYAPMYKGANGMCLGAGFGCMGAAYLANYVDPSGRRGKKYAILSMLWMCAESFVLIITLADSGWFE